MASLGSEKPKRPLGKPAGFLNRTTSLIPSACPMDPSVFRYTERLRIGTLGLRMNLKFILHEIHMDATTIIFFSAK